MSARGPADRWRLRNAQTQAATVPASSATVVSLRVEAMVGQRAPPFDAEWRTGDDALMANKYLYINGMGDQCR
jgi:hypothetical protein